MPLEDVIESSVPEVIERWKTLLCETIAPGTMPSAELEDHMPDFLHALIAELREARRRGSTALSVKTCRTAAVHGEHRLRLGFSLHAVVQEYGALRSAIVDTALERGGAMELDELNILFDAIVDGIAEAVSEYARQREVELTQRTNEHFAFIAHELRNPISSALLSFELLKQQDLVPHEGRAVAALEGGLKQTRDLIERTLSDARVVSGIEVRRERTTLRELVDEVSITASVEAEAKQVALRTWIRDDCEVDLDRRLVRSALGNLVRNGVKYTPPGGTVDLRAWTKNALAVFEVEDSCGGLPPGKVERVFAPFVRLDPRQPGFGLGLAIAKQAVDAHGGSIRVQNAPGKGCIFVLELPIAQPS